MRLMLAAAPFLLLAACGEPATETEDRPMPVEPDGGIGDGAGPPVAEPAATVIPEALLGRWGLVPADCEVGRPDAKGLMVVSPTDLRFYESVGKLGKVANADSGSIRASFAFTGEGMEWTRDMALSLDAGGTALVRREFGEDAVSEPLRYGKCN